MTVLESEDGITRRGGTKLAEVLSFRAAQEGVGHLLKGDGAALASVAACALSECGLTPQDVDLVVGIGQGTQDFLTNESKALQAIFGGALPPVTSAAMHLGYSPTAIFPQMVNLATAIFSGAVWREADRRGAVWAPGAANPADGILRILVLFTSVTFEHGAMVLGRVE